MTTEGGGGRSTREARSALRRGALLDAAADVVGAVGYANTSVADIARTAGVSQGTFYNYFAGRDDLFDQLLPWLGERMLDFLRARTHGVAHGAAREAAGFRAFFDFLDEQPAFYRVLYEAETFAPRAFRRHVETTARGYLRMLERSTGGEETSVYDADELEAIAYMLMGARHYIAMHYARDEGRPAKVPARVAETYMRVLEGGMQFRTTSLPPRAVRRKYSRNS